uniref:Thioredoxin domain-containing protein n=1 Tax=Aureoumbra lagunensis TaxID=44058 RepID=A0A7S3K630_9STRA|mmetsp:Transcript_17101/g.22173  ORF Transcript_17101/g.22173 Transcript_17101/m.22173 type:complete len:335 (-) Transcript_17101:971-1975(-)
MLLILLVIYTFFVDSTLAQEPIAAVTFDVIVDQDGRTQKFVHEDGGDVATEITNWCAVHVDESLAAQCAKALADQMELVVLERSTPELELQVEMNESGQTVTFKHDAAGQLRDEAMTFCAQYVPEGSINDCAARIVAAAIEKGRRPETTSIWGNFLGAQLLDCSKNGESIATDTTLPKAKIIGLLFAADWCRPCRDFTPKLESFYKKVNGRNKARDHLAQRKLEIVWISGSRDANGYASYLKTMPWLALPFEPRSTQALSQALGVKGYPTLIFFDATNGELITNEGVAKVTKDPFAFSFPYRTPVQQFKRFARFIGRIFRRRRGDNNSPSGRPS